MTRDQIVDEADALLAYLEERGLTEPEACVVIGVALQGLVPERHAASYVRTLAAVLYVTEELRSVS